MVKGKEGREQDFQIPVLILQLAFVAMENKDCAF